MHSRTPPRRAAFDIVSRLHLLVPLPTTPHAPHTPASRPLTPSHPLSPSASHSVTPPSAPQLLIPQSADRCWGLGWGWGRGRALRCGTAHLHGAGGGILQEPNDLHVVASLRKIQRCVATLPGRGGRVRRERRRGSLCARGGRPAGERAGCYMQPPSPQPAYHVLPRVSCTPLVWRTRSLRPVSAPALRSDSAQGALPKKAAKCIAVLWSCRDAATATTHTRGERTVGVGGRCGYIADHHSHVRVRVRVRVSIRVRVSMRAVAHLVLYV